MFRHIIRTAPIAVLLAISPIASAQFYGGGGSGCSSCGATPSYTAPAYSAPTYSTGSCAPISTVTSCTPIQPVYSTCYQRVPVTTYKQEEKQIKVPYYKTAYENRKVTTMVPVTKTRKVEVPTVSYKTVQQNHVVNRDMGRWVTNYQPVAKCKPCQVDPRPGMIGWLNRTGYSFRSAFTPNYRTSRQYVPKMMACNVATTRQVAVRGTRQVAVQETQMVAKTETKRVAVQKLAYRTETVQVSTPVTAYRTVPIGSALAYGGLGSGIVFADDEDDSQTALNRHEDDMFDSGGRTAFDANDRAPVRSSSRENSKTKTFKGSGYKNELQPVEPRSKSPVFTPEGPRAFQGFDDSRRGRMPQRQRTVPQRRLNSERPIVLSGWKASRQSSQQTASTNRRANSELASNQRN